jgi:hypothetical protein
MEKMSSEVYTEWLDKLADEVIDTVSGEEKLASDEEYEGAMAMAQHALGILDQVEMAKEAAEADYANACAYEDAAAIILQQMGYEL